MRCAVGCGLLERGVDTGYGLARVRGDTNHPVNRGLACRRGVDETTNPAGERLTRPLVREDGQLVPTSWERAIGLVVSRIESSLADRRDGVAVLGSGQQTNEAAYLLGKLARGVLGTRYYDANTTLCMASAVTAYYEAFGSDAPPPTYEDVPEADTHVVWGANPAVGHPVMYRWIADSASEPDGELIVVDPVESETVDDADCHVQLDPGTDLALARAVLARIVERGDVDGPFVEAHTEGFDALRESLPRPEAAAAVAGVSTGVVDRLAEAMSAPTLIYWGMGVNQSVQGTDTARALIDLCLVTGNLGPGTGPFSLTGQANSMGTRVCSSKGTWPGHRPFDDPVHRETVADAWDVPVDRLPDDSGPGPVGIVGAIADDPLDVCWTVATNPVAGMPDTGRVREALAGTFLIAQDAFRTETVELADVVLPAATWGESEGTVTNMERRISRVRAATDLAPKVKSDADIIAAVGSVLDSGAFPDPTADPEATFDELCALTAGTPADLSGVSYDRLDRELAVRWPAPTPDAEGGYRYVTDDGWTFPTESSRAAFSTGTHGGLAEPPDEEYPLTLTTGRRPDAYNTGIRSRELGDEAEPIARVHPETALERIESLDRGRTVITSRRASVTVTVQPDDGVPPGLVWLPIHHPAVNELTLPVVDPRSDEPNVKQCAVGLRAPDRPEPESSFGTPGVTGTNPSS